jgi:hypothetical protein
LTKIVSIKETSAIFLAIVLLLGTIALTVPSFSVEAQATSDREKDYDNDKKDSYGKDKDDESRDHDKEYDEDDEKSYGKDKDDDKSKKDSSNSVFVKKVKCNNINVNLNGVDVDLGLPINGPIAVAQEAEEDDEEQESNSIKSNDDDESDEGKDRQSDSNKNSKIVCINNNNNIVIGEEEPPTCEDCFTTILTKEKLDDLIEAIIEDGGPPSLEELCDFIAGDLSEEGRAFISDRLFVLGEDVGISEDKINKILDCLEEVFGGDFPREIIEEPLTTQQMKWKS